ncbi:MAG: hypothetical protein LUO93_04610, partial [Methanomicrobiales archaeon]|nr:hypothetical protein [Methanomicrobiales archaeon]
MPAALNASPAPIIRRIEIEGNSRISAASILRQISSAPNMPFDSAKSQLDLKKLYALGLFEDLQVQSRDAGEGQVDIVYRVREYPFISGSSIEGVEEGLENQLYEHLRKEKLELHPATPFNPALANKNALAIRDFLRSRKHPNADVSISTEKQGNTVRVLFKVNQGQRLEVGAVRFIGNDSLSQNELLNQMKHACPAPFWARWGGAARYIPEELNSDLQQIRIYYKSHGFAAVSIGEPHVKATSAESEKQRLEIEIPIVEGARYRLVALKLEGDCK